MNKLVMFSMLMVCQLICCFALSVISPFFPPFAREHGISEEIVGIIFISNPLGALIAAVILGKILSEVSLILIQNSVTAFNSWYQDFSYNHLLCTYSQ